MKTDKTSVIGVFDQLAAKGSWENLYSGQINRTTYNFVARLRATEELLAPHVQGKVLDIGCGTGDLAPFVVGKGARYVGMDLSAGMIERANARHAGLVAEGKASFTVGDCDALPFADGEFDAVVAIALMEYLPDPEGFLGESDRVLRDGGALLITVPYKKCISSSLRRILSPVTRALAPIYARLFKPSLNPMSTVKHYSYGEEELAELVEPRGFERVGLRYANFHLIPYPLDHLIPKMYIRLSERVERKGRGERCRRWASNYIALFRKNARG